MYALCYSCIECCWSFDFCSQNWFHCYSSTALIGIPVPWYLNHKHNSLFTDTVFESQCFTFSSVDWQQTYFTYTDPARQSNSHHTCHVTRNLVPAAPWPVRMPAGAVSYISYHRWIGLETRRHARHTVETAQDAGSAITVPSACTCGIGLTNTPAVCVHGPSTKWASPTRAHVT